MEVLMDYVSELNWLAVLAGTVAAFVVGAVWYSQAVFGKQWMKGAGLTEKETKNADMVTPMVGGVVTTLISTIGLAVLFDVLALEGVLNGALLGAMVAVAFVVTNKVMHNLFEQKPSDYMLITISGDIVALAVAGAVLALLR